MSKGAMRQVFVVFQTEWSSWELYAALPWTLDIPCWTLDITCWTLLAGHSPTFHSRRNASTGSKRAALIAG